MPFAAANAVGLAGEFVLICGLCTVLAWLFYATPWRELGGTVDVA